MNRASDIERILAHIGDPEMRYLEFETPRDESRARADWSLLDSAAGGKGGQPVEHPPEPARAVDSARRTYVERELAVSDTPDEAPAEAPPSGEARGQLQRVFARLRGDAAPAAPREEASAPTRDTPLSQIFRRLS